MSRSAARARPAPPGSFRPRQSVDWTLTSTRDRALDDRILQWVERGDRVLDLGCGRGDLLVRLKEEKKVRERGVEIDGSAATEAISRGLSVVHGDLADALSGQKNGAFDVVILNQVITSVQDPAGILAESVRVGRRVLVTFPNFAHWKNRLALLLSGRLPVTPSLPYQWFDTPQIRVVTVRDFRELCRERGFLVKAFRSVTLKEGGQIRAVRILPNLRASSALFVLGG